MKLWAALIFFAAGSSMMRQLLARTDFIRKLGDAVFLPNVVGWTAALWGVATLMIIWYLLSAWNEQKKQSGVLQL